jgi:hypothetical protein
VGLVGWKNSSTGGRDVDIDLHSKRVGSLIKQRFVAKELVLLLPKRKRAKREKENEERLVCRLCTQLTIGPEYKPPSVIQ